MKKFIQTLLPIIFKIYTHLLMTKHEFFSHALNSPINNYKKSLNLLILESHINNIKQQIVWTFLKIVFPSHAIVILDRKSVV